MKNTNFETVETKAEVAKPTPLQSCFILYAGLYAIACSGRLERLFELSFSNTVLLALGVICLVFTVIILIYNHKREHRSGAKLICNTFALLALCMFLVRFIPYVV